MAGYAFRTLQARKDLQTLWENGNTAKDLAAALKVPLSTVYTELRRSCRSVSKGRGASPLPLRPAPVRMLRNRKPPENQIVILTLDFERLIGFCSIVNRWNISVIVQFRDFGG